MNLYVLPVTAYSLLLAGCYMFEGNRFKSFMQDHKPDIKNKILAQIAYCWDLQLRKTRPYRFWRTRVSLYMGVLQDGPSTAATDVFMLGQLGLTAAILFLSGCWAAFLQGGATALAAGCVLVILGNTMKTRGLKTRVAQRKQQIVWELPELIDKLALLVNAGETARQALVRSAASYSVQDREESSLKSEQARAVEKFQNQMPFYQAMEQFGRRCGTQEVSRLVTILLLNERRGGDELVLTLKDLSSAMWEKRKSMAKTLGEEVSSKLVFPMVTIFLIIMIMVAAPAIMMVN